MIYEKFQIENQKRFDKFTHYFPIYEKHFQRFVNKSVVVWEIGVKDGGSLQMWKKYFGSSAQIVGLDINPKCKMHEEERISVCIGDQSDTVFIQEVIDKYGCPDVVIDDGSHLMQHVCTTFSFLYDKISSSGVYLVEDMHTSYWASHGGGLGHEDTFIELSKKLIDYMNARNNHLSDCFADTISSISFYESIVVFEKMMRMNREFEVINTFESKITEKQTDSHKKQQADLSVNDLLTQLASSKREKTGAEYQLELLCKNQLSQLSQLKYQLEATLNSTSWKITRPFRLIMGLLRRYGK